MAPSHISGSPHPHHVHTTSPGRQKVESFYFLFSTKDNFGVLFLLAGGKKEGEIPGSRCHCMCLCLEEGLAELAVQPEKVVFKLFLSCIDRKHASLSSGEGQWFCYFYKEQ